MSKKNQVLINYKRTTDIGNAWYQYKTEWIPCKFLSKYFILLNSRCFVLL